MLLTTVSFREVDKLAFSLISIKILLKMDHRRRKELTCQTTGWDIIDEKRFYTHRDDGNDRSSDRWNQLDPSYGKHSHVCRYKYRKYNEFFLSNQ